MPTKENNESFKKPYAKIWFDVTLEDMCGFIETVRKSSNYTKEYRETIINNLEMYITVLKDYIN